jgi:hypothetical protein
MTFDPDNPVVALCVAGMQVEGEPDKARALFEQAWDLRKDDFDASIAAHYLARHQPDAEATLKWNALALQHADTLADSRVDALLPSLCLNLGDSLLTVGRVTEARALFERGSAVVAALPAGGYAELVRSGIARLGERVKAAESSESAV